MWHYVIWINCVHGDSCDWKIYWHRKWSHWPCITDFVVLTTYGLKAYVTRWARCLCSTGNMGPFTFMHAATYRATISSFPALFPFSSCFSLPSVPLLSFSSSFPVMWWGTGVVICLDWSEVQMICIWSSWCHCYPVISCSSKIQNDLPFWCRLTQVVLEKAVKRM